MCRPIHVISFSMDSFSPDPPISSSLSFASKYAYTHTLARYYTTWWSRYKCINAIPMANRVRDFIEKVPHHHQNRNIFFSDGFWCPKFTTVISFFFLFIPWKAFFLFVEILFLNLEISLERNLQLWDKCQSFSFAMTEPIAEQQAAINRRYFTNTQTQQCWGPFK